MINPGAIPLSLYIHLPWCTRKCPYCDFNSHEGFSSAAQEPYVAALLADLDSQWCSGYLTDRSNPFSSAVAHRACSRAIGLRDFRRERSAVTCP